MPARPLRPAEPTPISLDKARRLVMQWAEQAEAAGDDDAAARHRALLGELAPGYVFEGFISWQVADG